MLGAQAQEIPEGLGGVRVSLVQEDPLWGTGGAVAMECLLVSPGRGADARRRGRLVPKKNGYAPPAAPHTEVPQQLPSTRAWPASGRLEKVEEEVLWEKSKPGRVLAACSHSGRPLVPGRLS